jgi:hypothetical protein
LISETLFEIVMKAAWISGAALRELLVLKEAFVSPLVWARVLVASGLLATTRK